MFRGKMNGFPVPHHSVLLLSCCYCAEPLERAQTVQNISHSAGRSAGGRHVDHVGHHDS